MKEGRIRVRFTAEDATACIGRAKLLIRGFEWLAR